MKVLNANELIFRGENKLMHPLHAGVTLSGQQLNPFAPGKESWPSGGVPTRALPRSCAQEAADGSCTTTSSPLFIHSASQP